MNIAKVDILSRVLDDRCDDRDFVVLIRIEEFYFCRISFIVIVIIVVIIIIMIVVVIDKIIVCSVLRSDTSA